MRTIEYQFTQEDLTTLSINTDPQQVLAALGYLTTWAMDSALYAGCTIWIGANHTEINANYREGLKNTYAIGGVWNGTSFGFHS